MTLKVTGNFGELRKYQTKLRQFPKILAKLAEAQQETALNLISDGFRAGTDPYGSAWNAPNNLQITGRLRSYAKGRSGATGWQVHSTDQKAIWHHAPQPRPQWGGKSLPVRLQVPTQSRGLPPVWATALEDAAVDILEAWIA